MVENSILDELEYDELSGALKYKEVRYLLIRPETIAGFQKDLRGKFGKQSDEAFYQGGFRGGYLSAKKYREILHYSEREILDFMMRMGTEIGWGHFRIDVFDPLAKKLQITVENSPFAEAYGPSPDGVCHLIRGVLGGLGCYLFSRECAVTENRCRAKGDDDCMFFVEGTQKKPSK